MGENFLGKFMAGYTILRNYLFLLNNNTGRAVSFVMYMCIIIIDVHVCIIIIDLYFDVFCVHVGWGSV